MYSTMDPREKQEQEVNNPVNENPDQQNREMETMEDDIDAKEDEDKFNEGDLE